jgi:hypothetical protein
MVAARLLLAKAEGPPVFVFAVQESLVGPEAPLRCPRRHSRFLGACGHASTGLRPALLTPPVRPEAEMVRRCPHSSGAGGA